VPSYSLQYICEKELGIGKLGDGSYDLRDLYLTNYNEYIDYNVVDNLRIKELEDKLGFLKLAQSLCLLCKCPMNMYSTTTSLIEGLMLTRYRRKGLCAPRFVGGQQEPFEAAFVKEPQKGLHE
jgi:DNA polymerase elongation subunit (family B)